MINLPSESQYSIELLPQVIHYNLFLFNMHREQQLPYFEIYTLLLTLHEYYGSGAEEGAGLTAPASLRKFSYFFDLHNLHHVTYYMAEIQNCIFNPTNGDHKWISLRPKDTFECIKHLSCILYIVLFARCDALFEFNWSLLHIFVGVDRKVDPTTYRKVESLYRAVYNILGAYSMNDELNR